MERLRYLEIILYFSGNIILILLGILLLYIINLTVGEGLIASGLVGIIMFWTINLQSRRTEKEKEILKKVKKFGIRDILSRRLTKAEADEIFPKRAKKKWDVLGLSLKSFYTDVKDGILQDAIKRVKLRVLVIHPESLLCEMSDKHPLRLPGTTKNEIKQITKFILNLKDPNAQIRWYKCAPTTSLEIIDDEELVAGPYLEGIEHRNTYSIRLREGLLFDLYITHFNKIWNDPELSCEPDINVLNENE